MIIAATNPTIPASPKAWTNEVMLVAMSPTNGTFPPNRLTTIPKPSNDMITLVKLSNVALNPVNIFISTPSFIVFI